MRKRVIIILCFLMVFISLGFCGLTTSIYLVPITEALDIKRSTFSLTSSINYITSAVVSLFFGTLSERVGLKKLVGTGFLSLIISRVFYIYADRMWGFCIGSIFLGIGLAWTTTTMVGCIVSKCCKENQGIIMGAILASSGLGGAFATQILSPMIYQENNPFGYRASYKLTIILLFIIGLLFVLLYNEKFLENDINESAVKEMHSDKYGKDVEIYKEIRKEPYFYICLICIFLVGGILEGVYSVFPAHMKDVGIDETYVVMVVSMTSLILAAAKFLAGILYDKCGLRFVTGICHVAACVAFLVLIFLTDTSTGVVLAVVFGVIFAISLPLESVLLPLFSVELFNRRAYNITLGLLVSVNTAGYACCIPAINWAFDVCGSYKPVLWICFIIMMVIAGLFQYIIKVAKKHYKNRL